jgi:hypothetical protein
MAVTYEPIATQTLGSSQTTITFNSFSGYTDLRLIVTPLSTADGMNYQLRFNSDSGTNYSLTYLRGNGSTAVSNRQSNITFFDNLNMGVYTTTPHIYMYDIMNYSNSTTYKTVLNRFSEMGGSGFVATGVGLWRSTSAVSTITLTALTNQFATGSTFTLYGIKAA